DADLGRPDQVTVGVAQMARRIEGLGALNVLPLLLRAPAKLRLELFPLDPGRDEDAVEGRAGLARRLRDRRDLRRVVAVRTRLGVVLAALDPEDDEDDDDDRRSDQSDQPQDRRQARRRAGRASWTPWPS